MSGSDEHGERLARIETKLDDLVDLDQRVRKIELALVALVVAFGLYEHGGSVIASAKAFIGLGL